MGSGRSKQTIHQFACLVDVFCLVDRISAIRKNSIIVNVNRPTMGKFEALQ